MCLNIVICSSHVCSWICTVYILYLGFPVLSHASLIPNDAYCCRNASLLYEIFTKDLQKTIHPYF